MQLTKQLPAPEVHGMLVSEFLGQSKCSIFLSEMHKVFDPPILFFGARDASDLHMPLCVYRKLVLSFRHIDDDVIAERTKAFLGGLVKGVNTAVAVRAFEGFERHERTFREFEGALGKGMRACQSARVRSCCGGLFRGCSATLLRHGSLLSRSSAFWAEFHVDTQRFAASATRRA